MTDNWITPAEVAAIDRRAHEIAAQIMADFPDARHGCSVAMALLATLMRLGGVLDDAAALGVFANFLAANPAEDHLPPRYSLN